MARWVAGGGGGTLPDRLSEDALRAASDARYARQATLDTKGPGRNTNALRYFRAQLARRESNPLDLVFIGHSLVEGEGATTMLKRGQDRLKAAMRARYQPTTIPGGYGYLPVRTLSTTWSMTPYITLTGGATNGGYGLGRHSRFVNAAGAKVTLAAITCTAVDVVYVQGGGGTFTTSVDGVASGVNQVTTGSPTALKRYRVPGITARGSHTVDVNFVSGNSIICGFVVYDGDETAGGLRFWNDAQGGLTSAQLLDPGNVHIAGLDVIPNPALLSISCFANDYKTGASLATSKANLTALLGQLRAKAPNASIVLNVEHGLGGTGATIPWADYANIYYEVAEADGNVAVFDFYQRIGTGTPPSIPGLITADNQHYTDAGYLMWADALFGFITP